MTEREYLAESIDSLYTNLKIEELINQKESQNIKKGTRKYGNKHTH